VYSGGAPSHVEQAGTEQRAISREIAEDYFSDPNWSILAWGRRYYEREKQLFGNNMWPTGLAANRTNLERLMMYSRDQGLIRDNFAVDDLLASSTQNT
jgi:4,5-dihydroxyphthalate decarboxylase